MTRYKTGHFGLWLPARGWRRPMLRNAQRARLRAISCLTDCELRCHPHDSGRRATGILRNHASQEPPASIELKMPPPASPLESGGRLFLKVDARLENVTRIKLPSPSAVTESTRDVNRFDSRIRILEFAPRDVSAAAVHLCTRDQARLITERFSRGFAPAVQARR